MLWCGPMFAYSFLNRGHSAFSVWWSSSCKSGTLTLFSTLRLEHQWLHNAFEDTTLGGRDHSDVQSMQSLAVPLSVSEESQGTQRRMWLHLNPQGLCHLSEVPSNTETSKECRSGMSRWVNHVPAPSQEQRGTRMSRVTYLPILKGCEYKCI